MSLDTDFAFGANLEERTLCLVDSDSCDMGAAGHRITWADVEAARREARADVGTVADAHWTRALAYVARLKVPCVRAWAGRWLEFCTSGGARPLRHLGEAGKACRAAELELARLGVVDPYGFEAREDGRSGPSKSRDQRKRQKRGGECNGLKDFNERMRSPWIG